LKVLNKADDIRVILEYRAQGLRISTHARKGADRRSRRMASGVIPSRIAAPHHFTG